ncbi:Carnosine synthase 1 [Madurella fahalii]|uniref:Carnosine synthase 1 n=1 Tax=Madurella fahalii TaxID=1157608 RepID=A0ABQ0GBS2_9PEZI
MAVGVLPGQVTTRSSKVALGSFSDPISLSWEGSPTPLNDSCSCRPFFWEVVRLCDLYSIAHVILLPSSLRSSYGPAPTRNGVSGSNGVDGVNGVNGANGANGTNGTNGINGNIGHRSASETPTRLIDALGNVGLGPANWAAAGVSVFTAILPTVDGYASRSDFLRLRLQDCPFAISKIHESVNSLKKYTAFKSNSVVNSEEGLASLIDQAAGIVQWADLDASVSILDLQRHLLGLTHELRDRLNNAPWLISQPIARKRVALIRGRPNITAGGPVYRAAKALGLDLVIVDEEGHWLQADTEENRMHREAFLVTDMTEDDEVVDRIINSIASYPLPIHGVFTLSDNFFVAVAKVAEALGLPASPVSAFETSVDKYRSRLLQDSPGHTARVSSVEELEALFSTTTNNQQPAFTPTYPMIVKPTKGWSSECVSKVSSGEDLAAAVRKATSRHGSAAVIEPFFEGPEIDVNFVLLDGQILFCEIADEPPCRADSRDATVDDTFSPEALTLPSALPADEQEIARSTLRDILVRLGFRTGIFHVEARMVNSRCEYRDVGDGVIDLVRKETAPPPEKPTCRLLEINARPPGYRVTVPSRHTYGVDFFAVHMLAAVGDADRLRLAARPFDHGAGERTHGAQYWSRLIYVPAPKEGIVRWTSGLAPCEELKRRRPDLAGSIVLGVDYCRPGEAISLFTDGARTYVAHLLVRSTVSRRDAIEVGNEVLRSFIINVEEPSVSATKV